MARGSTVVALNIELSDVDRGVYDSLELKMAQHPSETTEYLVTRALAYALEYTDGIAFTEGLASGELPPVWVRDLTGQLVTWVDVGTPTASRLHKASKAAHNVAVYCHSDPGPWLANLATERIHNADALRLFSLPRDVVRDLAASVDRRNAWSLTRMEGTVYLESGDGGFTLPVSRHPFPS